MLSESFSIAGKLVGVDVKPYIIAEAGSNFNQNMDTARKLIDIAAQMNADAVKFQLFRAEVLDPTKRGLYDLFKSIELNPDWVPKLMDYARETGIHFSASAFDLSSVKILEDVGVPFHKIASSETSNLPLVHKIASTAKPILMSTGMCDMVDIEEAVNVCRSVGNDRIVLMQCSSIYPLPPELVNLRVLKNFASRFGGVVGFSDHTIGMAAAPVAVGLGASVFEKHFTLDKNSEGPDHSYASEPEQLRVYIETIHEAHLSLGSAQKAMLEDEKKSGRREGLYAAKSFNPGDRLSLSDIVSRRPAVGLPTRYLNAVNGAKITKNISKGEPLTWASLSFEEK